MALASNAFLAGPETLSCRHRPCRKRNLRPRPACPGRL